MTNSSPTNRPPRISIVIPACNAAAVIAETLRSVQSQTFSGFEALVVDDGSSDDTGGIVRQFVSADPRFRLITQANAGSAVARNRGLQEARGGLIAFLDADDVWFPAKLESQLRLLEEDSRANLVFANNWVWDGARDIELHYPTRGKFPEGDVTNRLIRWDVFRTSTVMVKREILDQAGGFDPELRGAQDWDLWLRIAERGLWARGVWEPQARYRIWPGNISADKIRCNTYFVRMYEKAVARPQPPDRLRRYRRALRRARAHLELARAQSLIDTAPAAVPPAVLRAWQLYPPGVKWLFRYFGLVWPAGLGGHWTAGIVLRKLRRWRRGAAGLTGESDQLSKE